MSSWESSCNYWHKWSSELGKKPFSLVFPPHSALLWHSKSRQLCGQPYPGKIGGPLPAQSAGAALWSSIVGGDCEWRITRNRKNIRSCGEKNGIVSTCEAPIPLILPHAATGSVFPKESFYLKKIKIFRHFCTTR